MTVPEATATDLDDEAGERATLRRLVDRSAIDDMVAKYADFCDHKRWNDVVALFTSDAEFDAETVYGRTMRGPDEILEFFEGAPVAVAHHPTTQYVEFVGDGEAATRMKMLVVFPRSAFSVDYQWRVVRTPAGWRIARQKIDVVGKASLGVASEG